MSCPLCSSEHHNGFLELRSIRLAPQQSVKHLQRLILMAEHQQFSTMRTPGIWPRVMLQIQAYLAGVAARQNERSLGIS